MDVRDQRDRRRQVVDDQLEARRARHKRGGQGYPMGRASPVVDAAAQQTQGGLGSAQGLGSGAAIGLVARKDDDADLRHLAPAVRGQQRRVEMPDPSRLARRLPRDLVGERQQAGGRERPFDRERLGVGVDALIDQRV